jgi:hypothetical protein
MSKLQLVESPQQSVYIQLVHMRRDARTGKLKRTKTKCRTLRNVSLEDALSIVERVVKETEERGPKRIA